MSEVRVAAVQFGSGLDPAENRERIAAAVAEAAAGATEVPALVVFPEAASRDFGPPGSDLWEVAEPLDGPFSDALRQAARKHGTVVVAGMFERSEDPHRPFNTLVVVGADGVLASYRKIHLYDSFGFRESDVLSPGPLEPVRFSHAGLTWGLLTCYDLRFPEQARVLSATGVDALVVPAAWVAGPRKVDHWRTLLRARAIENVAYVVAAAQPAPRYTGLSSVIDPRGDLLDEADAEPGRVVGGVIDPAVVVSAREENPSLANRRL